jgi:DNA-binding CsgD family transcriptional regulator
MKEYCAGVQGNVVKEVFERGRFLQIVGIGLYIASLRLNALVSAGLTVGSREEPYLAAAVYLGSLVLLIVANRTFGWKVRERHALVAGAVGSIGLLLLHSVENLRVLGLILSNSTFAIMTICFGLVVASMRKQPKSLALSLAAAAVVSAGLIGLIQLFSSDSYSALVATIPFLVGLCLTSGEVPSEETGSTRLMSTRTAVPAAMLLAMAVGYILCSILSGVAAKQFTLSSFTTMGMYALSAAIVILLLFLLRRAVPQTPPITSPLPPVSDDEGDTRHNDGSADSKNRNMLETLWPFLAILLLFGLLCFVSVFPIEDELSYAIALACLNIFYFGFLILGPAVIGSYGLPFVPTYGILTIISYGLLWRSLGGLLSDRGVTAFSVGTIGMATVLFLLTCLIVVINHHIHRLSEFADTAQQGERAVTEKQKTLLETLAQSNGITAREQEVCDLLLQGHSALKIASKLYVSESTVRFHLKNIYRKLEVHSKQELFDLIDDES